MRFRQNVSNIAGNWAGELCLEHFLGPQPIEVKVEYQRQNPLSDQHVPYSIASYFLRLLVGQTVMKLHKLSQVCLHDYEPHGQT